MTQNAKNVSAAKPKAGGAVWSAPLGTEAPTDAVTTLAAAFHSLGYCSDGGIVNSIETDTESVPAFGGDTVLELQTSRKETFKFTPIELNQYSLGETYGDDNVTLDDQGNLTILHNGKEHDFRVYVFEILLNQNRVKRIVVPNGKITEVGDVSYVDGEPIGSELTLTALPDESGNTAYAYIAEVV